MRWFCGRSAVAGRPPYRREGECGIIHVNNRRAEMTSDEKRNICDKRSRELFDLLNDVDELDWLEAKSLRDDS